MALVTNIKSVAWLNYLVLSLLCEKIFYMLLQYLYICLGLYYNGGEETRRSNK